MCVKFLANMGVLGFTLDQALSESKRSRGLAAGRQSLVNLERWEGQQVQV